jgi:ribose 5-phosphate isomerase A
MNELDKLKLKVSQYVLDNFVEDGISIGLGTGSTVNFFLKLLGERIKEGKIKDVVGLPSSLKTEKMCEKYGVPYEHSVAVIDRLRLAVDGADRVDEDLNMLKGLGGAFVREHFVSSVSPKVLYIMDKTKRTKFIYEKEGVLPVEVLPFEHEYVIKWLEEEVRDYIVSIKKRGYRSDNGNIIVDLVFKPMKSKEEWDEFISKIIAFPTILGTGYFRVFDKYTAIIAYENKIEIIDGAYILEEYD